MRKEMWSVQVEANGFEDDLFNGTFEECKEYAEMHNYSLDGEDARLAKLLIEDDIVIEVLDYYVEY